MNIKQLIQVYGNGKGEDVMWNAIDMLSEKVSQLVTEEEMNCMLTRLYGIMQGGHYDEYFAEKQVRKMYYIDKNGMRHHAPYWTPDEVKDLYEEYMPELGNYNFWDFYVTINMIKSDNCNLLHEWFPEDTEEQHTARMVEMAVNWLKDEDNPFGNEKIWKYFNSK